MKILINRNWNRIEIYCNEKAVVLYNINYPIHTDYYVKYLEKFTEDSDTLEVLQGEQNEYFLFNGADGEYIYLELYVDENEIKLWGTDGKGYDLDCYAEFKNSNWSIH